MDPFLGLLMLYLLSRKGSHGSSTPSVFTSSTTPATGPAAFPPVPATAHPPPVPSPSVQAGKKWQVYHPLNQAVIARAQQLLHDPTMKVNDERIEADPAGAGQVRYLKVSAPPGKVSVTAWKPAVAPTAPTAAPHPSRAPLHHGSRGGPAKAWHALSG